MSYICPKYYNCLQYPQKRLGLKVERLTKIFCIIMCRIILPIHLLNTSTLDTNYIHV